MNKPLIVFAILLVAKIALAAGGEHGDGHIPMDKIAWQAVNLGILLFATIFFIRKSIAAAFVSRQKTYLDRSEKTKTALREAEAALSGIKQKLARLESGEGKSLEDAQHEANLLKAHMIREAEEIAAKIKTDATRAIENELNKAKSEINELILNQALSAAKSTMTTAAGASQEASFVKQLERASI